MSFEQLALPAPILRAVRDEGYLTPTPIQMQAIPPILEGRDLLGCAQTGTGKTAAFTLPILARLSASPAPAMPRCPQVLVLAPTRELAAQIDASVAAYGRHLDIRHTVVFGGVSMLRQIQAMRAGVHVLVATPGRLLDLCRQREVRLDRLQVLVLDESDRMLDMGFLPDVRRILAMVPKQRQTLLFSATMPNEIRRLCDAILHDPATVSVDPPATTAEKVDQSVYFVDKADKRDLLLKLLDQPNCTRTLVFTRTKHGANRVTEHLTKAGVAARAIHGNKSQNAREQALHALRSGEASVVVATDIAARGIDIDGLTHVINFDVPNEPESYVHRIGRTGRAGAAGIAITLCDRDERSYLAAIERKVGLRISVAQGSGSAGGQARPAAGSAGGQARPGSGGGYARPGSSGGHGRPGSSGGHGRPGGPRSRPRSHAARA